MGRRYDIGDELYTFFNQEIRKIKVYSIEYDEDEGKNYYNHLYDGDLCSSTLDVLALKYLKYVNSERDRVFDIFKDILTKYKEDEETGSTNKD